MAHCSILGAGNWATAFARVLAGAGHDVTMLARRAEVAEAINQHHRNLDYLSDIVLPDTVRATTDLSEALGRARTGQGSEADPVGGTDMVVVAIPAQQVRAQLATWARDPAWVACTAPILSLVKGIDLSSDQRMSQVIAKAGGIDPARIAVLSGPNLAREIAEDQPSLSVIAAPAEELARTLQQICLTPTFRTYTLTDVVGVEIAGAAKNVIALGVGMGVGLGYGHNALASLITRGLAQVAALGKALGGEESTFSGLAGLGDLVATCSSPLSRNRTFGQRLGEGATLEQATRLSAGVAEGVATCRAVHRLAAELQVDMPIVDGVVAVIDQVMTPGEVVAELMGRVPKPER